MKSFVMYKLVLPRRSINFLEKLKADAANSQKLFGTNLIQMHCLLKYENDLLPNNMKFNFCGYQWF